MSRAQYLGLLTAFAVMATIGSKVVDRVVYGDVFHVPVRNLKAFRTAQDMVRARGLEISDEDGNPRAILMARNDATTFAMYTDARRMGAILCVDNQGSELILHGTNRSFIRLSTNQDSTLVVEVRDSDGNRRVLRAGDEEI